MRTFGRLVYLKFLLLSAILLALLNLDASILSGLERVMKSAGSSVINSTAESSSLYRFQETSHLRRRFTFNNRRLLLAEVCSKSDISIVQDEQNPLPNGVPSFSVQISNLCPVGCAVTNIHVACGWFSSATLINPQVFRRLAFNDCLVNDGNSLDGGDIVTFQYSNSFEYPMRIESASICGSL